MDSMTLGLLIIGSIGAIVFIQLMVWIVVVTRKGSGDFLRFDLGADAGRDLQKGMTGEQRLEVEQRESL